MRQEWKKYYLRDMEQIYPYGTILKDNPNYLTYKNENGDKIVRHVDGKTITIVGSFFSSRKYKDEVNEMYQKVAMRIINENHIVVMNKEYTKNLIMDIKNSVLLPIYFGMYTNGNNNIHLYRKMMLFYFLNSEEKKINLSRININ